MPGAGTLAMLAARISGLLTRSWWVIAIAQLPFGRSQSDAVPVPLLRGLPSF